MFGGLQVFEGGSEDMTMYTALEHVREAFDYTFKNATLARDLSNIGILAEKSDLQGTLNPKNGFVVYSEIPIEVAKGVNENRGNIEYNCSRYDHPDLECWSVVTFDKYEDSNTSTMSKHILCRSYDTVSMFCRGRGRDVLQPSIDEVYDALDKEVNPITYAIKIFCDWLV